MTEAHALAEHARALNQRGEFAAVIALLEAEATLTPAAHAHLGAAYFHSAAYAEAEHHLTKAVLQGHQQANVTLAHLLRVTGRVDAADELLTSCLDDLPGEARDDALRCLGIIAYYRGQTNVALQRFEQAYCTSLAFGDDRSTAMHLQALGEVHRCAGSKQRALQYLQQAHRVLPAEALPGERLPIYTSLINLHMDTGDLGAARAALDEARAVQNAPARYAALLSSCEAALLHITGSDAYETTLQRALHESQRLGETPHSIWASSRLAEHYACTNRLTEAMHTLFAYGGEDEWAAPHWTARGMIDRKRGDFRGARGHFERALKQPGMQQHDEVRARTLLYLAATHLALGDTNDAVQHATDGFKVALKHQCVATLRPYLQDLPELLAFARTEPGLTLVTEPVLLELRKLPGAPLTSQHAPVRVHVTTLGGATVHHDGRDVPLRPFVTLILVYLHEHGATSGTDLYRTLAENDNNKAIVRQAIKTIRDTFGEASVLSSTAGNATRYQLAPHMLVSTDIDAFYDAISRSDVPQALALYQGDFLPEFTDPTDWVAERREQARIALTNLVKTQLRASEQAENHARVVLLANEFLRIDAYDIDIMRRRLRAARHVSSARDIALYEAQLAALTGERDDA